MAKVRLSKEFTELKKEEGPLYSLWLENEANLFDWTIMVNGPVNLSF